MLGSHCGQDAVHDGTRYIQAALAYPAERRARWHTLAIGEFGAECPLLIWSDDSGFVGKMACRWSGYYEHHAREPEKVFELAAYAASQYRKTDSRAVVCMPDFSHEGPSAVPVGMAANRRDPIEPSQCREHN